MYEKITYLYIPRYISCVSLYTGQNKLGITNFNQNFRVKFDMTMIFLFLVKTPLATI